MRQIFVFGSNEQGYHGAGSALHARIHHGAELGVGNGMTGDSYAIPTKDKMLKVLPLDKIGRYVMEFLDFADKHREMEFNVVKIGCGFAGYKPPDIKPMFRDVPPNVKLLW